MEPDDTRLEASAEHRREHRHRVLKGASIVVDINTSIISCTIRNLHDHGAELKVPGDVRIPPQFLLYIPTDRIGYRCVVRWHRPGRIGVEFLGQERKPHWLYA